MALLEVCGLHKSFGNTEVLRGISFTLERGQVLSLIGSSGSGKTTLLRCLNFLETPDAGRVLVDGHAVWDTERPDKPGAAEAAENQRRFGMVFQQFNLFPHYTIRKNLTLAPTLSVSRQAKTEKWPREKVADANAAIEEQAKTLLASVGLADRADDYPYQLSGGQCQRVAIARALMLSPTILCFDEPTSALDPELTNEVLRVIRGLRSSDRTMIIVTHEMEFARAVSDKVIFMADGVIAEEGTPDEVFGAPKSEKLRTFLAHHHDKDFE